MSNKLKQLAQAAVAIPGMVATAQAAVPADTELSYRYTSYNEDDSPSSRDDSGGSQPRYSIDIHQFRVLTPITDDLSVDVEGSFESMSGASPVYSYIPDGEEDVYTHFAGASEESRFDLNAHGRKYFSTAEAGAGVYLSKERDYFAVSATVDGAIQINNQMTTLSGGLSVGYDWLNPTVVDSEGNVTNGNDLSDEELDILLTSNPSIYGAIGETKWQVSVFEGIGQIIDMNTVVQGSITITYKDGYMSDPYRNCVGANESIAENVPCDIRPSNRTSGTLSLGARRFLPALNSAVHLDYRLYLDSWDILSNTFDVAYYQNFAPDWSFFTRNDISFQAIPALRYYQQTEAYFYDIPDLNTTSGWAYTADSTEYYSSDPRLSQYGAISVKLSGKVTVQDFAATLGLERYMSNPKLGFSNDETPGLVSYWRVTMGLDYRF